MRHRNPSLLNLENKQIQDLIMEDISLQNEEEIGKS